MTLVVKERVKTALTIIKRAVITVVVLYAILSIPRYVRHEYDAVEIQMRTEQKILDSTTIKIDGWIQEFPFICSPHFWGTFEIASYPRPPRHYARASFSGKEMFGVLSYPFIKVDAGPSFLGEMYANRTLSSMAINLFDYETRVEEDRITSRGSGAQRCLV